MSSDLIRVTCFGTDEEFGKALIDHLAEGGFINATDENGDTALIHAARLGLTKRFQALVDNHANIHLLNEDDCDALTEARENGHEDIIGIIRSVIDVEATMAASRQHEMLRHLSERRRPWRNLSFLWGAMPPIILIGVIAALIWQLDKTDTSLKRMSAVAAYFLETGDRTPTAGCDFHAILMARDDPNTDRSPESIRLLMERVCPKK